MKKILSLLITWLLTCFVGTSFASDKNTALTIEQKDVIALMQSLYKIPPETFEFKEFDYDFKLMRGHHSIPRHNELMVKYFDAQILVIMKPLSTSANENTKTPNISKITKGYEVPLRYPKFEDVSSLAEINSPIIPKVKVGTPIIEGERAKVIVNLSDGSLCQYFLKNYRKVGVSIKYVHFILREPIFIFLVGKVL